MSCAESLEGWCRRPRQPSLARRCRAAPSCQAPLFPCPTCVPSCRLPPSLHPNLAHAHPRLPRIKPHLPATTHHAPPTTSHTSPTHPPTHTPPLPPAARFARDLGAFINLESTGPWGPDVVFQVGPPGPPSSHGNACAPAHTLRARCTGAAHRHGACPTVEASNHSHAKYYRWFPRVRAAHGGLDAGGVRALRAPPPRHHHGPRLLRPGWVAHCSGWVGGSGGVGFVGGWVWVRVLSFSQGTVSAWVVVGIPCGRCVRRVSGVQRHSRDLDKPTSGQRAGLICVCSLTSEGVAGMRGLSGVPCLESQGG